MINMANTKQFHVSAQKRTFFDRKVLHYGYSRTISMGKIIPKEWRYVRLSIITQDKNTVTVTIEKLMGDKDYARHTQNDKTNRPNS